MSSSMVLSLSSNCLSLRSVHKHHIRQQRTIFHTTALQERPPGHQQANKSITRKGITQDRWVFTQIDDVACLWTMIWRIAALQYLGIVEDLDPKEPDKFLRLWSLRCISHGSFFPNPPFWV
jgi:hypothetical protein